jgi:hypothetical protein
MKRAALLAAAMVAALFMSTASKASAGEVLGTVTPTAIAPEVEVCLVEAVLSETCTSPGADGTYTLTGMPVGVPLRIEFIPSYRSHYLVQYYDHAPRLAEVSAITLTAKSPVREHVDAELEVGGAIEGVVSASGGGALSEVEVCVLQAGSRVGEGCTSTDEAGDYALGGLPTGSYELRFWGRGKSAEYAPQYYEEKTIHAEATAVSVTAGATVTGIGAAMTKGATVTGTVVAAASGAPLEGIPVCLFGAAALLPSQCVYSGFAGSYEMVGVPAGGYQVGFSLSSAEIGGEAASSGDDGYLPQYYPGVASLAEAQVLTLSGEQVAGGVNAALLTPVPPPVVVPPVPVTNNVVAAPTVISEPIRSTPLKCKKGSLKTKVKAATKCVKKPARKYRQRSKKSKHGKSKKQKKRGNPRETR